MTEQPEYITYHICKPADHEAGPIGEDGLNAVLTLQLGDMVDSPGLRDFVNLMFCQLWDTHVVLVTTEADLEDIVESDSDG